MTGPARNWQDHQHSVPCAGAAGPCVPRRRAGNERLGRPGHRRCPQQDQDVCPEESHSSPRPSQGF